MADDERWHFYEIIRARGDETFRRLHALEQKGYRRDRSVSFAGDALWYVHPRKGQPKIILYPDGKVVATGSNSPHSINPEAAEGERDRIFNLDDEDAHLFDQWISSVREPTPWQRTQVFREELGAWGCIILLMLGSYALVSWFLNVAKSILGWG